MLSIFSNIVILILCAGILVMIILAVIDRRQTKDSIRHNYPLFGRFRYLFLHMGEFFRQYFFAMDREEMPFNRAQRQWVYKSSKGEDNTAAFGSTANISPRGSIIFANTAFPLLDEEKTTHPITFGPHCQTPYTTDAFINVSAMSFGALSKPAIQSLSRGARLAHVWLNTGEGGLSSYHLEGDCDIIFQIGTAKYGVRAQNGDLDMQKLQDIAKRPQVKMIEIKLAQGAKPGKGGLLPGEKVTAEISKIRGIPQGEPSISPNRHKDINSVGELLDRINEIRQLTGKPVGFKTVMGHFGWLHDFCEEIQKRGLDSAPDFITLDGGDGGTGAAPMPLMDNVGLTLREALPEMLNILIEHGVRKRIKVICSGKLITPVEVAWAYCCGADMVNTARGFMLAMGCIQALKCNRNTCPTGITTHDKKLQGALVPEDKAKRIQNFVQKMEHGVLLISHSCGVSHPRLLLRHHVRIVQENGQSVSLDKIHPYRSPLSFKEVS